MSEDGQHAAEQGRGRWAPHLARRPRGEARAAILDAARRLFAERGFAAVGIGEIADAARVGRGTLYQHWPSKEDLLLDCCLATLEARQRRLEQASGEAQRDPAAALRRVLAEALDQALTGPGQQRLFTDLWQALADRPQQLATARRRWNELQASWEGLIGYIYRSGVASGVFRRAPSDAALPRLLGALIDGLAWQQQLRGEGAPSADEQARLIVAWLSA
ncbi:MAG: helix-turn-helix domain-containing protein [Planctomycetota bacterium]|nr:TetR/AcrR family transcriptional regulator [Planctomycetota bacterium]MCX8040595.1 TetR/AcrR family transcriptional regulator [Planctomycetota bacterium]MDW8373067.1 helix-turn-helix domain-containing protein [Planctomycetota bacterium]